MASWRRAIREQPQDSITPLQGFPLRPLHHDLWLSLARSTVPSTIRGPEEYSQPPFPLPWLPQSPELRLHWGLCCRGAWGEADCCGHAAQILEPAQKGWPILPTQARNEILPLRVLASKCESVSPASGPGTLMGFSLCHL